MVQIPEKNNDNEHLSVSRDYGYTFCVSSGSSTALGVTGWANSGVIVYPTLGAG